MKVRVFYKDKMWEVITEFYKGGSTFGRLERKNEDGTTEVAFPSGNEIKVRNENTGLQDRNGKDIFGGDVVKWRFMSTDVYDLVTWHGERTGYLPFIGTESFDGLVYPDADEVEVIGNIYENPELDKLIRPEIYREQTEPTA